MRIALDTDVLIYASSPVHPFGQKIRNLLTSETLENEFLGSALLLPELFIKPTKLQRTEELDALKGNMSYIKIISISEAIAIYSVTLAAIYGLRTPDALHLASAIDAGADQFLTNNRKDFKKEQVLELAILHPDDL